MTYATFVANLMDLTVTGVTRVHDEPPAQISTADLPVMYPRLPELSNEVISLGLLSGLPQMQCEVVILVEPIGQSINSANFAAMVAIIDAFNAALVASDIRADNWSIRQETAVLSDTPYWALVATVEAS